MIERGDKYSRLLVLLMLSLFWVVEIYSISFAIGNSDCGLSGGLFEDLFCFAVILFIGVMSPLYALLLPIGLLFFGLAMPIASANLLWSAYTKDDGEQGFSFLLGAGLAVASYFFITKLLIIPFEWTLELWGHIPLIFYWLKSFFV